MRSIFHYVAPLLWGRFAVREGVRCFRFRKLGRELSLVMRWGGTDNAQWARIMYYITIRAKS